MLCFRGVNQNMPSRYYIKKGFDAYKYFNFSKYVFYPVNSYTISWSYYTEYITITIIWLCTFQISCTKEKYSLHTNMLCVFWIYLHKKWSYEMQLSDCLFYLGIHNTNQQVHNRRFLRLAHFIHRNCSL